MSSESFESSLKRLESVVERLEQGELTLDEGVAAFEEGVTLSRRCRTQLDQAEQRIEQLSVDPTPLA